MYKDRWISTDHVSALRLSSLSYDLLENIRENRERTRTRHRETDGNKIGGAARSCPFSSFLDLRRGREGERGRVNSIIGVGRPGLIVTKDRANRGKLTSKLPRSGRATRNR